MNNENKHIEYGIPVERIEEMLEFTDIYITTESFKDSYLFYKNNIQPQKIPHDGAKLFKAFIKVVFQVCKASKNREDHLVVFEDRYFRCSVVTSVTGVIIIGRQMPKERLDLSSLKLGKNITNELTHERLNKGGLIIICGSPGNGKTTTSTSLIIKRLEKFGGMCITIEDPPEVPLDGRHGIGTCIQTQVKEAGFAASIRSSMRSYPTGQNAIMFVGEVRDSETAEEVIKASIDGRLVITTLHADSVLSAVQRICSLAQERVGDNAYNLIGDSLRIAIHQDLMRVNQTKLEINVECLVNTTSCVNIIKKKNFNLLKNEAEGQKRSWENGKVINYHNNK